MRLDGPKQFKEALTRFGLQERRDIRIVRNTKHEVRAKCANSKCPWMIFASYDSVTKRFLVKTYMEEHTCQISYKNKRVTTKWLAKNYLAKFKCLASMRLVDLKQLVKEDLKVEASLNKIRRAKLQALSDLQGQLRKEFEMLWDYLGEIERSNPGSTTVIKVQRPIPDEYPIFDRLYISFDCLKKGMLSGCRKVIGLDGCFLKGIYMQTGGKNMGDVSNSKSYFGCV
ncbi:hypothetical protein DITRI_Ditri18aG0011800 [Diplodiscus trichospermus]